MMTYPNHKLKLQRRLEYLPGSISWFLILFPIWGSLVVPELVAYYILAFNVYWFYRSVSFSGLTVLSHFKINAFKKHNWFKETQAVNDWQKVNHIIILPTYKEPLYIIERTMEALKAQTFPLKQLHVILAFEEREGPTAKGKSEYIRTRYQSYFGTVLTTFHPVLPNEVVGKSSNMAWASKKAKQRVIDERGGDIDFFTITSEDIDVCFDRQYYACLAYHFLKHPHKYERIWQPAILFYNNIWEIPAPVRVFSTIASTFSMGQLLRKDRLINFSTYSISLKLVDAIGYWDTDVIPEDYRMFFKAYFKSHGKVSVEPIFLPAYADAAHAGTFWATMINQYEQVKRWAWGSSDIPWMIQQWLHAKEIPFWDKTLRVLKVMEDHILWPVNWFAITLGATLPPLLNETFARTVLGKTLPQTSSTILTLSLVGLMLTVLIDYRQRPNKDQVSWLKKVLSPMEFFLLPVIGFFFSALPGLDAHTRLLLGRYIEYRTTEKV